MPPAALQHLIFPIPVLIPYGPVPQRKMLQGDMLKADYCIFQEDIQRSFNHLRRMRKMM
jgi:hypothetical protein